MNTYPLDLLAASNPVRELPPVAPVESLRFLNEPARAAGVVRPRRPRGLALRAAIIAAVVAGGTAFALSAGSSGPGVDVAAAAYAATSAGNGVIEAEFIVRSARPGVSRTPLFRRREWLDAATGRRREQTLDRNGMVSWELATAPGSAEVRISAGGAIIPSRVRTARGKVPTVDGLAVNGLALYRQLYQGRGIRVVGRQRLGGQLLWKLEGVVAWETHHLGSRLIPVFGEVVLVDPHTYLPVMERQVDLTRPGHPTMIESRLVRYRELARTASSEHLVLLGSTRSRVRR